MTMIKSYFSLFCLSMIILSCQSQSGEISQNQKVKEKPQFTLKIKADALKVPEEIVAFSGTNLMSDTFGQIEKTINPMLPQPLLIKELWLRQYTQFHLKLQLENIDLNKPIRFVNVIDQKQLSSVQMLSLLDPELLKKQMGENLKEEGTDQSKRYVFKQYANDPSPLYFYIEPEWNIMVSSTSPTALDPKLRAFYLDLFQTQFDGLGSFYSYPSHSLKLWDGDLSKAATAKIEELSLKGDALAQAKQQDLFASITSTVQHLAQDSQRVVFTVVLTDGEFQLRGQWTPKEGSVLANTAQALSVPTKHELLAKAPQNTPLFASFKLPPTLYQALVQSMNSSPKNPMAENADLFKQYLDAVMQTTQALDGELLFLARTISLTPEMLARQEEQKKKDKARKEAKEKEKKEALNQASGKNEIKDKDLKNKKASKEKEQTQEQADVENTQFPFQPLQSQALSFAVLFSVTDAKLAREKQDLLLSFYQKPELTDLLRKMGILVEVLEDEQKIGEFQSKRIVGKMARLPAPLKLIKEQLKEIYDAHLVIGEKLGVIGFGTSWLETLQGFSLQGIEGGLLAEKGIQRAFEKGAKNPFFMFYLEPTKTISSLKQANGGEVMLGLQMMLAAIKNEEGFSISLGAHQSQYEAVIDMPLALIKNLLLAFTGATGSGLVAPPPMPELPPAGQGLDATPQLPPAGQGLDTTPQLPPAGQGLDATPQLPSQK